MRRDLAGDHRLSIANKRRNDYRITLDKLYQKIILALLFIILFILAWSSQIHPWGDTSTYYMMIDSIANDGDIKYSIDDINRIFSYNFEPRGLFLVKNSNDELYYGKEFTYALLASPFYILLGNRGIFVFNSVMFFLIIVMGYFYLKRYNNTLSSLLFSFSFFVFSTTYIYIYWVHADIYNVFLITCGFFFWSIYVQEYEIQCSNRITFLIISSIIFGIATFSKLPNAVGLLPILLLELYKKNYKNFIYVSLFYITSIFILYTIYYIITGNVTPYSYAYYYPGAYPYWNNCTWECGYAYSLTEKPLNVNFLSFLGLHTFLANIFYYIFGRFTGIIWYYPFTLLCIFLFVYYLCMHKLEGGYNLIMRRVFIVASIIMYILIYLYLDYGNININYFGGQHAIGNRYFYIYPGFLFLITAIKINKKTILIFLITVLLSIVFIVPLIYHPIENSAMPMDHTNSLPYEILPLEYTQLNDLPLWNPQALQINDVQFFFPISNTYNIDKNVILHEQNTEILIKMPYKKYINLSVLNIFEDKNMKIRSENSEKVVELHGNQPIEIMIPLEPKLQIDENTYIYKVSFSIEAIRDNYDLIILSLDKECEICYSNAPQCLSGCFEIESHSGVPKRWINSNATFIIYSDRDRTANLSFEAVSFYRERSLEVRLGNKIITHANISSNEITNVTSHIDLVKGTNIVNFYVPEGCERPIDKPELSNSDSRCLSVAIQNVDLDEWKPYHLNYRQGFYEIESWSGVSSRWMQENAAIHINSSENSNATLSLNALSFYRNRTLEIYSGDNLVMRENVPTSFMNVSVPVTLKEGLNILRLHVPEGCERPCDIKELNNPDSRCLCIAVQNITVI